MMAGEDNIHKELINGRNSFEIHADITQYFKVTLKDKKPTGKIIFLYLDKGTEIQCYSSYTNKRPDKEKHVANLYVAYIP